MANFDSIKPNNVPRPPKIVNSNQVQSSKAVNLATIRQKSPPKKFLRKILTAIILVIVILGAWVLIRAANLSQKIFVGQKTTFWGKVVEIIRGGGDNGRLIGEDLGQVNVLILGIGGEGHDGPYLTDTMILAQIRPDISEVTLTSIPRDYWSNMPGGGQAKANMAFSNGYLKNHDYNEAGRYAREAVQNMSGLQIPYFAVMDFSGFEQAVNQVGGLDVKIDNTFTDSSYPDSGTGFLPPITFTAGNDHMDGTRALEFVRSRHAAGIEGSDFARSLRQQKIIEAFKQKVLGQNLISDANNINKLFGVFADHFHTNMSPAETLRVYNITKNNNLKLLSLSLDPDTFIVCPEILAQDGAYVLVPCPGKSEQDVQDFFKNSFSIGKLKNETPVVWLASSTGNTAAYQTAFRKLSNVGITVFELSYTKDNLPKTIVYQVNPKPAAAEFIRNSLKATEVTLPPPDVHIDKSKVDVIVVLGENALVETPPIPYVAPPARVNTSTPVTATSTKPTTATSTKTSTTTPSKKK